MLSTLILDIIDKIKYDLLLLPTPPRDAPLINSVPRNLTIKVMKGESGYTLLFPDLPGMILYSDNVNSEEVLNIINDGLSVYFDIPRYHAKDLKFVTKFMDAKGRILVSLPTRGENLLRAYK